jgi:hypothetical protein
MLEPRPLARFEGDVPPGSPPQEQWLADAPVVPPAEPLQRRAAAAVPVPQQPAKPLAPAGTAPATPPAATPRAKPVLPVPTQPVRVPEPPRPRLAEQESRIDSRPTAAAAFATPQDNHGALTESPPQARPPLSHPATALPVPLPVPKAGRVEGARVPPPPPSSTARPRLDAPADAPGIARRRGRYGAGTGAGQRHHRAGGDPRHDARAAARHAGAPGGAGPRRLVPGCLSAPPGWRQRMSNFHAVASVTTALRARVLEVVQADVPGAGVTTLRPGRCRGRRPAGDRGQYLPVPRRAEPGLSRPGTAGPAAGWLGDAAAARGARSGLPAVLLRRGEPGVPPACWPAPCAPCTRARC